MSRRILHVVGDSRFGGGGVLILALAEAAAGLGDEVAVLTTDPVFQEKLRDRGIRCVDLDVIRRPIRPLWDLGGLFRLWRYLRAHRYDLIHTHTSKAGFTGRFAARLARVDVIIHTVHGFAFHEQSRRLERWIYVWLERLAARACDVVVTVSEYHRQVAEDAGIGRPGRLTAVPNGLNPERVVPTRPPEEIRRQLGLESDQLALVSICRLAEQKGLEYAIDALGTLELGELPPLRLVLAGDGPLAKQLQARAEALDLLDNVMFLGFRDDVADLLSAADIVLLPTLHEGLSISLLEAMAAEKAIITTTIPSNLEVTQQGMCAVLVPPKDIAALAAAIRELALDPGRRRELGSRAKQVYATEYTMDRMLSAYLGIYRRYSEESSRV